MDFEQAYLALHQAVQRHFAWHSQQGIAYGPADEQLWQTATQLHAGQSVVADATRALEQQAPLKASHWIGARPAEQRFTSAANEEEIARKLKEHPDVPDAVREEWNID